jgi:N-acetylglutamate synthase-like GNAT family acetyltransferase
MTGRLSAPTKLTGLTIRGCETSERAKVLALLAACGLPEGGLGDHWRTTWVAVDTASPHDVIGSVALEVHGGDGLLRSLAIRGDRRSSGLGSSLFDFAMARAGDLGLGTIALLTTTAEAFFARRGFATVPRAAVPESLHASAEFRGACPGSAQAMLRPIR